MVPMFGPKALYPSTYWQSPTVAVLDELAVVSTFLLNCERDLPHNAGREAGKPRPVD